jgi:hypothetical protein
MIETSVACFCPEWVGAHDVSVANFLETRSDLDTGKWFRPGPFCSDQRI